ncbi:MAG: carbon storage regulator CsrA [Cellulosilyticaceae bacterium]
MLALTRKKDEAIIIDGKIKIQVLDVIDGKVKLGIEAPREMSIHREEVYIEIQESNKVSTTTNKEALKVLTALIKNTNQ